MIEVENLTKSYEGHWAVRGVSFSVGEGDECDASVGGAEGERFAVGGKGGGLRKGIGAVPDRLEIDTFEAAQLPVARPRQRAVAQ